MDAQNNPNFQFNINLSGVAAASGGSRPLPTGYFTAKIADLYHRKASTGRDMIEFKIEITESGWEGIPRTFRINVPTSADDGVRHYWRAAFESIGFTAAQIDGAGDISIQRAIFLGKPCYIHYVAGDKDAGVWDKTNMIPKSVYDSGKMADQKAEAAMQSAPSLGAPVGGLGVASAPANGGLGAPTASAMTPNALLNALGSPSGA